MPTPCSSCLSQNPICLALPPYLPPMYRTNSVLFSWIVFPHTPHFTSLLLFPHPSCHFQTSRINYLNSSLPLFHQAFPLIICECIPPPEVPKTELQSHLWPVRHMLPNWTSCNDANVLYLHFLVATGHTWLLNTWSMARVLRNWMMTLILVNSNLSFYKYIWLPYWTAQKRLVDF